MSHDPDILAFLAFMAVLLIWISVGKHHSGLDNKATFKQRWLTYYHKHWKY